MLTQLTVLIFITQDTQLMVLQIAPELDMILKLTETQKRNGKQQLRQTLV